jgi:hypothetical protein
MYEDLTSLCNDPQAFQAPGDARGSTIKVRRGVRLPPAKRQSAGGTMAHKPLKLNDSLISRNNASLWGMRLSLCRL